MSRARVAIVYGFCEGPRLGYKLRGALEQAGFEVVNDARHADILIAHSAGCWMLPKETEAKTVLLVGISLQPVRSLVSRFYPKVWHDFLSFQRERRSGAWFRKTFWNLVYFGRLGRNSEVLRAHTTQPLNDLPAAFIVVQNRNDAFATPNLANVLPLKSATFVNLPGEHDDLWEHPEPYVALVRGKLS